MKTSYFAVPMLLCGIMIFSHCTKDNQTCPNNDLVLQKIEPASNPTGYEVRLIGSGFTSNTKVRFDNSESTKTTLLDPSTLIATIPGGVLGAVEISVSENDCIARNDRFEVYSDFPGNIPFSPNTIIIPQPAANFPSNFQNSWENMKDIKHNIFLDPSDLGDGTFSENAQEFYDGNDFFNLNKITGHFRRNETTKADDILIEIDRKAKPGGSLEIYTGVLVNPASVGSDRQYVLLLTSQKDGRQLLFQYPN